MSHFELPEWRKLSRDEQMEIVNLPTDRTYIVVGEPGTGKKHLAIACVAKIRDTNPESTIRFLVYSKSSQLHLSGLLEAAELDNIHATMCHAWIWSELGIRPSRGFWAFDWNLMRRVVARKWPNEGKPYDHLIIYEAQDIPKPLLEILHRLAKTATIFIDPRYPIHDEASEWGFASVAQIRSIFAPEGHRTFELTQNYRNTREILEAALVIQPLEEYETPKCAIRRGAKPLLQELSPSATVTRIQAYFKCNPTQSIGILVPYHKKRDEIYELLEASGVPVQRYKIGRSGYDPCAEGITVLTYNAVKGLEFDAVFMLHLEDEYFDAKDSDLRRNIVYVAATRARSYLALFHDGPIKAKWLRSVLAECVSQEKVDQPTKEDDDIPF